MKAALVAFIAAIAISSWSYVKLLNRAGYGNTKTALTGTAAIFGITFVVVFTIGLTILR
ncbi:MAG TPA: hypothetical protein VGM08_04130 [Candidatus Saccharimonadales bacterium]|jgi:hypothetical protein